MSISFTEEQVFNQEVIDCDWYEICVRWFEDGIMKDEDKICETIYEEEVVNSLNEDIDYEKLNYGDEVIVFVCKEDDCNRERIFEWIKGEELNELIGEIPEEEFKDKKISKFMNDKELDEYIEKLKADCKIVWSDEEDESEEEEEVRCVCDKCFGEGMCYVSKERARELEKLELIESECPYGDKCEGEEEQESK
jgi:hypothetical protein